MLPAGAFFPFAVVAFVVGGGSIGVVVTAVGSAVQTPTRLSFVLNLILGMVGFFVGFFLGIVRGSLGGHTLPDDGSLIWGTAIWGAVLLTGTHEALRWWLRRRRSSRQNALGPHQPR